MVRINLIDPARLADQHLMAEYNEILMLLGYVRRYPDAKDIPDKYTLGKGHIKFFKNKLKYIKDRHELLKTEMGIRGFAANITINLEEFEQGLVNDWQPQEEDVNIIKQRLVEKFNLKPNYYKYHKQPKSKEFFVGLLK